MLVYPHIDNINSFKKQYKNIQEELEFDATVKIHGTNMSIIKYGNEIIVQSRNGCVLGPLGDMMGFYTYYEKNKDEIVGLFESIKDGDNGDNGDGDVIVGIFGEWCGSGIQKGVGINNIGRKTWIIFDVIIKKNDVFSLYDIRTLPHSSNDAYYIIYDFPHWTYKISNFDNLDSPIMKQIQDRVQEIENECPVAKQLGASGIGEGLVLKCGTMMFKMKGLKHARESAKPKVKAEPEMIEVSEDLLMQGFEYMDEQQLKRDMTNYKKYLDYILESYEREINLGPINKEDKKKLSTYIINFYKANIC